MDSFKHSPDSLWRRAWSERIEDHIDDYPNSRQGLIDLIVGDEDFAMYDNFFSIQTYPEYADCRIMAAPKHYDPYTLAFAFPKGSPYLGLFNHFLYQMLESGSTKQIVLRYISDRAQRCPGISGHALGYNNCLTAFMILLSGAVVSFGILLAESFGGKSSRVLKYFHDEAMEDENVLRKVSSEGLIKIIEEKDEIIRALKASQGGRRLY